MHNMTKTYAAQMVNYLHKKIFTLHPLTMKLSCGNVNFIPLIFEACNE